jgi:hypothetical protein
MARAGGVDEAAELRVVIVGEICAGFLVGRSDIFE